MGKDREISNTNEIQLYFHCRKCIKEKLSSNIAVGWTELGIQVWCETHEINIIHIDFEGVKHRANISSKSDKEEIIN